MYVVRRTQQRQCKIQFLLHVMLYIYIHARAHPYGINLLPVRPAYSSRIRASCRESI